MTDTALKRKAFDVLFRELGEMNTMRFLSQITYTVHRHKLRFYSPRLCVSARDKHPGTGPQSPVEDAAEKLSLFRCRVYERRDYARLQETLFKDMTIDDIKAKAHQEKKYSA